MKNLTIHGTAGSYAETYRKIAEKGGGWLSTWQLFEIHGSKLKPRTVRNLGQPR